MKDKKMDKGLIDILLEESKTFREDLSWEIRMMKEAYKYKKDSYKINDSDIETLGMLAAYKRKEDRFNLIEVDSAIRLDNLLVVSYHGFKSKIEEINVSDTKFVEIEVYKLDGKSIKRVGQISQDKLWRTTYEGILEDEIKNINIKDGKKYQDRVEIKTNEGTYKIVLNEYEILLKG